MKKLEISISLDYEMIWGFLHNKQGPSDISMANIERVPEAVKTLVRIMDSHNCKSNWGMVDALAFSNFAVFADFSSAIFSSDYADRRMGFLEAQILRFGQEFFFNPSSYDLLHKNPNIRIGSHTFSHLVFNKPGDYPSDIFQEILASEEVYRSVIKRPKHFYIFAENKYSFEMVSAINNAGFECFRGIGVKKLFDHYRDEKLLKKFCRVVNSYIGLHSSWETPELSVNKNVIKEAPATIFFRFPGRSRLAHHLLFNRMRSHFEFCSANGITAHIWWHPHNFSCSIDENASYLVEVLEFVENVFDVKWRFLND